MTVRLVLLAALLATLPACAVSPPDAPRGFPLVPKASIAAPSLRGFVDGRTWVLERDLVLHLKGHDIRVPAGFITDLASIPRLAERARSPVGTYNRAAIVHDWLYWTGLCSREESDRIFRDAMLSSGSSDAVAMQVYRAVRLGGASAYDTNAALRRDEAARPGSGDRRLIDMTGGGAALEPLDDHYWPAPHTPEHAALTRELRLVASPADPQRAPFCDLGIDPDQTVTPREYRPRRRR